MFYVTMITGVQMNGAIKITNQLSTKQRKVYSRHVQININGSALGKRKNTELFLRKLQSNGFAEMRTSSTNYMVWEQ